MSKRKAIEILDMFPDKQCSLSGTEFAYTASEVWDAVKMAAEAVENAKTYEDGLADAWEAARKITAVEVGGGLPETVTRELFGNGNPIVNFSPQEAIAKIKEYEDSREIKRGDEVMTCDITNRKGIVTKIDRDNVILLLKDGEKAVYNKGHITKTGRNFADKLDALLSEIGGNDDVEKT